MDELLWSITHDRDTVWLGGKQKLVRSSAAVSGGTCCLWEEIAAMAWWEQKPPLAAQEGKMQKSWRGFGKAGMRKTWRRRHVFPNKTSSCRRCFYTLNLATHPTLQWKRTPTLKYLFLFMHLSNTERKVRQESDLSEACIFINISLWELVKLNLGW